MRRKSRLTAFLCVLFLMTGCSSVGDVVPEGQKGFERSSNPSYLDFFAEDRVHDIQIRLAGEDWETLLRNAQEERKEYYTADVTIDGIEKKGAGLRARGDSSLREMIRRKSRRVPLKINFNKYDKSLNFMGLDELSLGNGMDDASFLREYMGYEAFRQLGMDVPLVAFCNVTVNGELWGMYIGVENVDSSFLERAYGNHKGSLYKAGPGSTLAKDMQLHFLEKKKGDVDDWSDLTRLVDVLNDTPTGEKGELADVIDVDSVLKNFAVAAVIHGWDDYAGEFCHNYYLYREKGRFRMIPWDMNETFLQTEALLAESDGAEKDVSTPLSGRAELRERPLVEKVLSVPEYYRTYLEYCGVLADWLGKKAPRQVDKLYRRIAGDVEKDPSKFYSTEEFEKQFQKTYSDGLCGFIRERAAYLKEELPKRKGTEFPVE